MHAYLNNFLKILGSKDDIQDNVSARLNKTALVSYRIAGLCGLVEAAFGMVDDYLEEYITFGEGEANEIFFYRSSKIAERKYGLVLRKEERFIIDTDICKRAHDVTVQNLAQYMALMKIQNEDKKNWLCHSGRSMRPTMRFTTTEESIESVELMDASQNSVQLASKITLPLTRKQQNMLEKINNYKARILLHPSLVFVKSGLYVDSFLKKASSILESSFLQPLVTEGYLVAIPNGLVCCKSKSPVYIKMLPTDDEEESRKTLTERLASFQDQKLNYNTYMTSCNIISLNTKGVISDEVLEVLQLERYQRLNLNLTPLFRRVENEYEGQNLGKAFNFNLYMKTMFIYFLFQMLLPC
jgi:hypothetical protein